MPHHACVGPPGGFEDVERAQHVVPIDVSAGTVRLVRDVTEVDHGIGIGVHDRLPRRPLLGQVQGSKVNVLDPPIGEFAVDRDHLAARPEMVDDPAARTAERTPDDDRLGHAGSRTATRLTLRLPVKPFAPGDLSGGSHRFPSTHSDSEKICESSVVRV